MSHNSTLSLGNAIIHLTEVTSTNDLTKQLLDEGIVQHGTFVYADYQSKGRGQEENAWESNMGENLLCSLVLVLENLRADRQVYLNICVSLAVYDMVAEYCPTQQVSIKWPNDIYVGYQKIAGMLVENSLQGSKVKQSVVGMGININQQQFTNPKACSLSMLIGHNFEMATCIQTLLKHFNTRYQQLQQNQEQLLWNRYHEVLYLKDIPTTFDLAGEKKEGIVKGIDEAGRLLIEIEGVLLSKQVKEIKWL